MSISVETGYLRGYANQIQGTHDGALVTMRAYYTDHCARKDGLDGVLAAVRPMVDMQEWSYTNLLRGAQRALYGTASQLRESADAYDGSDERSADRVWTQGRLGEMAGDHRERDVTTGGGFSAGATVSLAVPPEGDDTKDVKDAIDGLLMDISGMVEKFTGYDLLGKAMPVLLGDWGRLRSIADAHGQIEGGFKAIHQDLEHGMNVLSPHWDSGPGGAAAAFDYHVRERLLPAFEALDNMAAASEQNFRLMAQMYEYVLSSLLTAVSWYTLRIKKALQSLKMATSFMEWLKELLDLVIGLYEAIVDLVDVLIEQIKIFVEIGEQVLVVGRQLIDFMQNDFEVFRAA